MTRVAAALAALWLIAAADSPVDWAGDARALDALILADYAYLDRFSGGALPDSPVLARERNGVHDRASLLHYAEDRLATLADHHAATGPSFADSWALVPTYADLWVVPDGAAFRIDAVRADTPAARAGVVAGDRLIAVAGVPTALAVQRYWQAYGLDTVGDDRAGVAARVLAAGRRDWDRVLTIAHRGVERTLTLPTLYAGQADRASVMLTRQPRGATVRVANVLGDQATIAAFDAAMAQVGPREAVTIDLTETPSGGNTSVARAIMGWFVTRPMAYQVHALPAEERETGVARQWLEQVLPCAGKHRAGHLTVVVGRWTGSMGEGLAIGLRAAGARVCGGAMAGLRGAIQDVRLPSSGMPVKFPTERLSTVDGIPRERFVAPPCKR